jgi:hypothetical protein
MMRQYNTKVDRGTSEITVLNDISSDRYLILPGNSLDTQFPEGTLINGIFYLNSLFQPNRIWKR